MGVRACVAVFLNMEAAACVYLSKAVNAQSAESSPLSGPGPPQ